MAEEEAVEPETSVDGGGEAEALERLLDEGDGDADGAPSGKKKLIIILVLLLIVGGGAYYFLFMPKEESQEATTVDQNADEPVEEAEETPDETKESEVELDESGKPKPKKVEAPPAPNLYSLSPFFLPITDGERETGKFFHVTLSFLLSNKKLNEKLDDNISLIRRQIYAILKRKRTKDFTRGKGWLEERVKKEVLTSVNALMLRGTGTIDDVFYTEFVVL